MQISSFTPPPLKQAFSLVELSIVLVILGLLTGGILAGQSLIRAAELRAVATEFQRWTTATQTFRDKYMAIPGDMPNATRFWGDNNTLCADAAITNGTPGTCNGNGNGMLAEWAAAAGQEGEPFMFWQQLALAGFIEGTYDGFSGSGAVSEVTSTNAPRSKLSNGLWSAYNWNTTTSGSAGSFDGTYRDNHFQFGGFLAGGTNVAPLLKPEELWNIDTKIDDGRPAYGSVRERFWATCTTAATSADLTATYRLTTTTAVCVPIFIMR